MDWPWPLTPGRPPGDHIDITVDATIDTPSLLTQPWDPGSPTSGPLAVWSAATYIPGADGGGPGRYPNMQDTGAELSAEEPESASARPVRLTHDGERSVWIPLQQGNGIVTPWTPDLAVGDGLDLRVRAVPDSATSASNFRVLLGRYVPSGDRRSWLWHLRADGSMGLVMSADGTASVVSAVGPVTSIGRPWLRVTWRASDGEVRWWASDDGVDWEMLGTSTAGVIPAATDAPLEIGMHGGASRGLDGTVWAAEVRDGIDGPVVASWSAADMGQTGGVSGGREWTISRAAGNVAKSVVVDRDVVLFDGTDELRISNDPRLAWAPGGELTVLQAFRVWGAPGATSGVVSKRGSQSSQFNAGWALYAGSGGGLALGAGDGDHGGSISGLGPGADGLHLVAGVLSEDRSVLIRDGQRSTGAGPVPGVSGHAMVIGGFASSSTGRLAMEWLWTAVWRRGLSVSEIDEITAEAMGWPEVHAERIDIDPTQPPTASSGMGSVVADSACIGGGYRQPSPPETADGEWVEWAVDLSVGTWRAAVMHRRTADSGIMSISIDGVTIGTVDGFGAFARNVLTAVSGQVSIPGRHRLRITVDGRHAESTGYSAQLQAISLTRTDGT